MLEVQPGDIVMVTKGKDKGKAASLRFFWVAYGLKKLSRPHVSGIGSAAHLPQVEQGLMPGRELLYQARQAVTCEHRGF